MTDQVSIASSQCNWPEPHPPHLWSGEPDPNRVIYSHMIWACAGFDHE